MGKRDVFHTCVTEHQMCWQRNQENHQRYPENITITKLIGTQWQNMGQVLLNSVRGKKPSQKTR